MAKPTKPIKAFKHQDARRAHIPSAEEAGDEGGNPKARVEQTPRDFPRNPVAHRGQDPELFWLGKYRENEDPRFSTLNSQPSTLSVDIRSLYRHEHIAPETIIKGLYTMVATEDAQRPDLTGFALPELFGNAIGHEELDKVSDYYTHSDGWTNRLIQGDSLLVLTSVLEREGMAGQVQCFYFRPALRHQIRLELADPARPPHRHRRPGRLPLRRARADQSLSRHLGTRHPPYLSYLRDRLLVAREFLHDSGSCFVQISDENVHLVRCLMDEVFGSGNFCALIFLKKTGGLGSGSLKSVADYLIWYAKDIEQVKYHPLYKPKELGKGESTGERYDQLESPDGTERRPMTKEERDNPNLVPKTWRAYQLDNLTSGAFRKNTAIDYVLDGQTFHPGANACWKTTTQGLDRLKAAGRIQKAGETLRYKRYLDDFPAVEVTNLWDDVAGAADKAYVVQTSTSVVERCILMTTDPGDLVLDPTCGSGTTAYVAEQWGRRWITTDTSRIALNIAKTRLLSATFPYYLLYDSEDGRRVALGRETGSAGFQPAAAGIPAGDSTPARGASHPGKMAAAPGGQTLPGRDAGKSGQDARAPQCDLRQGFVYRKVPHITLGSIANGEPPAEETLYDQPHEDKKRLRVAGPFTVETLQNYEPISPEELARQRDSDTELANFEDLIFAHLQSAGVKTGDKAENAVFARIDRLASADLHAEGWYPAAGPVGRAVGADPVGGGRDPGATPQAGLGRAVGVPEASDPHTRTGGTGARVAGTGGADTGGGAARRAAAPSAKGAPQASPGQRPGIPAPTSASAESALQATVEKNREALPLLDRAPAPHAMVHTTAVDDPARRARCPPRRREFRPHAGTGWSGDAEPRRLPRGRKKRAAGFHRRIHQGVGAVAKAFMTVILTFEDEGGKTRYTARVRHWSVADREAHEKMGFHEGWGIATDQLTAIAQKI